MTEIKYTEIAVELLDHMGSDLTVVNAARVSFDKELSDRDSKLIQTLADGLTREELVTYSRRAAELPGNLDNIHDLRELKREPSHWTPFAHPHISVRIKVPLFLARQLVKHQVGGVWSEVSRRYVDKLPEFWKPSEWRRRGSTNKQGSGEPLEDQGFSQALQDNVIQLELHAYKEALARGVCPEQARILLPVSTMTEVVWTGSLAFFARVFNNRSGTGAQVEAREFARKLRDVIKPLFPMSWGALTGDE